MIRFSQRTAVDRTPNRLTEAVRIRRLQGRPLVDLTESNPTHVDLPPLPESLLSALSQPAIRSYDPDPFGLPSAREAVARSLAVPVERVVLSASTSESYALLLKLLCDPGDRILVPAPGYPLFDLLAGAESVELDAYPCDWRDRFALDVPAIESRVTSRTRALVVVSPNNPTGRMLRRTELETIAELCRRRGLALVVDEVFADWLDAPSSEQVSTAGWNGCLTFTLGGLSKSCLLPQLKLAWTVVGGPEREVTEALARWELLADSLLSVNGPVQHALPALLASKRSLQSELRQRLRTNREVLAAVVKDSATTLLPSDGGWSAVLRVPRLHSDESWAVGLVEDEGLLVHPGHFFDFPEPGFLVVSLLPEERTFAEAASRLVEWIESRAWGC